MRETTRLVVQHKLFIVQVRDVLYFAWREGKLNERMDDDGQLITVPPVKLATNNFICHTSIASFKSKFEDYIYIYLNLMHKCPFRCS